jgi:hypothetical protein
MNNEEITVKDIEEFLANRYERFASKKVAVEGENRYIFLDVCGMNRSASVYFHDEGERVHIFENVPFEQALKYWNN